MAEGKKVVRDDVKDHYESQVRSANYLLVAHAAGLVGCLSVFKDYAGTPQLKGMGAFVALFGVGLLCAIINYIGISVTVMVATSRDYPRSKGADQYGTAGTSRSDGKGKVQVAKTTRRLWVLVWGIFRGPPLGRTAAARPFPMTARRSTSQPREDLALVRLTSTL